MPQLGIDILWGGETLWFASFDAAVGRDEVGAAVFLQGPAGVGPIERMGHGEVVIRQELTELGFQFQHRGEATATQTFSLDDAENDFDLVEPRTVFWQINEADAVAGPRGTPAACSSI